MEMQATIPKLDLYNFDDPQHEDSRYVLTSPRSLRATSRLGVKPVDLLYKPLSEFQEELLPQEISLRTIYNIYDEHENQRQIKLKLCREERNRLVIEEERTKSKSGSGAIEDDFNENCCIINNAGISAADQTGDLREIQRKRTAWTTSIGHNRISSDEIDKRAAELHEESLKLRQELISRKEHRQRQKKTVQPDVGSFKTHSFESCSYKIPRRKLLGMTAIKLGRKSKFSELKIPEKDKKILALMKAKRLEEKAFFKRRQKMRLSWEEAKIKEETMKIISENLRRLKIAEENQIKCMQQHQKATQKLKEDVQHQLEMENKIEDGFKLQQQLLLEQQKKREQQLAGKRKETMHRKKLQERNLRIHAEEMVEVKRLASQKQEDSLKAAAVKRDGFLRENMLRAKHKNSEQSRRFKVSHSSNTEYNRRNLEVLSASIELKHSHAEEKLEEMLQQKELARLANKRILEQRIQHSKKLRKKFEHQCRFYHQSSLQKENLAHKQAAEIAARFAEQRGLKAREDRLTRQKEHEINIRKIKKEIETWKQETEMAVKFKQMKAEALQSEREREIQQNRAIAHESQKLRNQMRQTYDKNDFDKKILEAEMYTKIGNGIQTGMKNFSTF